MLLQDEFLQDLKDRNINLACFLVNGIKLEGQIVSFDQFSIMLGSEQSSQLVMKRAISTVLPHDTK